MRYQLRHAGGHGTRVPRPESRDTAWARAAGRPADPDHVAPTDDVAPLARDAVLPLDRSQLDALRRHVEALLAARGCDQTHRATDARAAGHGITLDRPREGLEEYGGSCDCEVVVNVEPAVVFDAGGQAADGQAAAGPSLR